MERNQFDTIYHEHFSYFSFLTVERVFAAHDLVIFDVEELSTHGGSLRIYARPAADASRPVAARVLDLRRREETAGYLQIDSYMRFADQVHETKRRLLELLIAIKRRGRRIAGYGAPGKGNTLLNYCGIRGDFLDFTVDKNPYKQGKFLPGTHVPIFAPAKLEEARPDYILILPWNFKDEIMEQLAHTRTWGGAVHRSHSRGGSRSVIPDTAKSVTDSLPDGPPKVSIGLPVYNGERYLREAIDSILSQTFRDFELILCDNASTDATGAVCREYARRDTRVRSRRNESNLGAARNFNLCVDLATGEYFKWAAHDDMLAPEYLARCVEALDRDSSVVVSHSHARVIDENGRPLLDHLYVPGHAASPDPARRFADLLREDRWSFEMFGVFRATALRCTRRLDNYIAADRILRAHLGLLGRYHIVPEVLFLNRDHPRRCIRALPAHHLRLEWLDPAQAGRRVFPHWRILYEYVRLIRLCPLSAAERSRCYRALLGWLGHDLNWARLGADLVIGVAPGSWRWLSGLARSSENWLPRHTDTRSRHV
jgi:glycosyltransferase involved in cell wall biosynthesis